MRKSLVLVLAAALVLMLLTSSDGTAQRWRGPCQPCPVVYYCPPCPVVYYYQPCPIVYYPCPIVYYSGPMIAPGVAPQGQGKAPPGALGAQPSPLTVLGKYRAVLSKEAGDFEHEKAEPPPPVPSGENADDIFRGKARKAAKLSIATAPVQTYDSISKLIKSFEKSDKDMKKNTAITEDPTSDRVAEEKRNVTVTAYIYAMRKEADNDFHVILGDAPDSDNPQYLNSEVSGLPTGGQFKARLTQVRDDFKSKMPAQALAHAHS